MKPIQPATIAPGSLTKDHVQPVPVPEPEPEPITRAEAQNSLRRPRSRKLAARLPAVMALILPPVLYLAFVEHYSVNVLVFDDWSVEVIAAHLGPHLGKPFFQNLWLQYNEHRLVVPKLLFMVFGELTALNVKTMMMFNAVMFVATYVILLRLIRTYCGRSPGALALLLLGAVWFSLSDFESALLSAQLSWYLILFLLLLCLLVMARERVNYWVIGGAVVIAVLASISSLQGLILWPVGLLCLWRRRNEILQWRRMSLLWVICAGATTAFYFRGFNLSTSATGGSSPTLTLDHPITALKFFFVDVGSVVPGGGAYSYLLHGLLGIGLTGLGVAVLVRSMTEVRRNGFGALTPLPAALILFGLLFDVAAMVGRVGLGEAAARAPRYTMPNLFLLVGIAIYMFMRASNTLKHRERSTLKFMAVAGSFLFSILLFVQIAESTTYGLEQATISQRQREIALYTLQNLPRLPTAIAEQRVSKYVYPNLAALEPLWRIVRQDHLNFFAQ